MPERPLVTIRDATADDAPFLTALVRHSAAYDGAYRAMVAGQTVDAAYVAAHPVRVAQDADARVVGFFSLLVPGRGLPGEAELDFMFVADDQQGRGVGRALIDDLLSLAAAADLRRIHVVAHPPAERFYRSVGAVGAGEIAPAGAVTWARPLLVFEV